MKIAFVVPYVPNLIRTRPYNLITGLSSLGHEVEVFTLGSGRQDVMDVQALENKCSAVHYHVQPVWRSFLNSALALPSGQPLQTVYSWQNQMARKLVEHLSREAFDIVHVEHLRGSGYGLFIKEKLPGMPVVWDSVDCISHLFQQAAGQGRGFFGKFITRFELERTRKAEGKLVCSFEQVLVTSNTDKHALLALAKEGATPSPVAVLPNGVDLGYFYPNPEVLRDEATLVFSGKMSYHANVAMVNFLVAEIMPRIWEARPDAQLFIVGKDPSAEIKSLEKDKRITVTGTVADIRPFLWRATVSVVPLLYGAGIQNKILEAMATGTPVVTTTRTLSALQAQPERDLLVGNTADELAQHVLRLISDKKLNQRIGGSGLHYVKSKHDWASIASELTSIYQHTLKMKTDSNTH